MLTIKRYFIILCLFHFSICNAQEKTTNFWDNVDFGGGVGLNLGNGFFAANVSPFATYRVTPQFSIGPGLNLNYAKFDDRYTSTIWGASILAFYAPLPGLQLSSEFEQLNVNVDFDNNTVEDTNYWYPALHLGAGYRTGNLIFGIRYDVLYDSDKSIARNPWQPFVRFWF